jgi:hypothetical protein
MEQQLALSVLVQAAQVAQAKGAFSLKEAGIVAQAVAAFAPPEVVQEEVSEEDETNTE